LIGLPLRDSAPTVWAHYLAWLGGSTKAAFVWGPLIASGSVTLIGNLAYALIVWPTWYRAMHKMHHEYTHTIAPAVLHLHPVEFLVSADQTHPPLFRSRVVQVRVLRPSCPRPTALQRHPRRPCPPPPPLLVGAHAYTGLLWVALRVAQTQESHCGYAWPLSPFRWLPANGSGAAHDAHHALNTGNYGR
jgi:sterol desaturase/sphingolipid hydroxylase (fatty acid hydroxylase superfamily)